MMGTAQAALEALLRLVDEREDLRHVTILESWVDPDAHVCVVYQLSGMAQRIGLRRAFSADLSPGEIETVGDWVNEMGLDLAESVGAEAQQMWRDDSGVNWWGHVPPLGRSGSWS